MFWIESMGRTTGQLKKMGMRMAMIQIMRRKALLPPHLTPKCSAHTESQSSTLTDTGHSFKLAGRGLTMEYWEQVFLKQCGLSFRNATLKPQASSTFKLSTVQTHKILSTHYTGKADFP